MKCDICGKEATYLIAIAEGYVARCRNHKDMVEPKKRKYVSRKD